ncbi:MAG: DUF5320 domain-containing protein [Candidatus Omnitrophica bacterium]|nr:DUF5320 domain-containing protein [Candidatus Omnitrophota bacterium]MDD5670339.1 DUF5320 domain-containing protein [Candidatus Omnitrophota bacterium]
MPGGDGTGPMGMGPMTGGGRGFCGTSAPQRFLGFGRGAGRGAGGGRGRRNWFYATGLTRQQRLSAGWPVISREEETNLLKDQAEVMTQQLENIRKRISELESSNDK